MTPEEFNDAIIALVLEAEKLFLEGTEKAQVNLWRTLSGLLDSLDHKNGKIKQTGKNLGKLPGLEKKVSGALVTKAYKARVESLVKKFDRLRSIYDKFLKANIEGFNPNEKLFDAIKKGAVDKTVNSLIGAGIDANLTAPIKEMLRQNITSGGSFFDLRQQLRDFIVGNSERLGRLRRYSGQITRDALNQFSANYSQAMAEDLGLEYYYYTSGTVEDSREFCIRRNGQYWHRKEVESWASLQWQGKIPATTSSSIFVFRGGYSCMHQILPVSDRVVPQSVKDRVKAKFGIKTKPTEIEATDGKAPDGFQFGPDLPKSIRDKFTFNGNHPNMPDNFGDYGIDLPDQFWALMPRTINLTRKKSKTAYYNSSLKSVNVPVSDRFKGYKKRSIIAHEYGHAWHFLERHITTLNTEDNFKNLYKNLRKQLKGQLGKVNDWDLPLFGTKRKENGFLDAMFVDATTGKELQTIEYFTNKIGDKYTRREISEMLNATADTIQALTNGKKGWGHTKSYYKKLKNAQYMELFAHLNENFWVGNPVFKELYPELYETGLKFMQDLYNL